MGCFSSCLYPSSRCSRLSGALNRSKGKNKTRKKKTGVSPESMLVFRYRDNR